MNPTGTDLVDANAAPSNSMVERLAQILSNSASARTIYSTPVERDGVTVIPVARAYYGSCRCRRQSHSMPGPRDVP